LGGQRINCVPQSVRQGVAPVFRREFALSGKLFDCSGILAVTLGRLFFHSFSAKYIVQCLNHWVQLLELFKRWTVTEGFISFKT
jgi:hypothetical protein